MPVRFLVTRSQLHGAQTLKFLKYKLLQIPSYEQFACVCQTTSRFFSTVPREDISHADKSNTLQRESHSYKVDFENTQDVYLSKKTSEILRAWFCLKLSTYDIVVDNFDELIFNSRRILGKKLFEALMKKTVYGQFAGGEDEAAVKLKMQQLKQNGIKALLAYATESNDLASDKDSRIKDQEHEINAKLCLDSIDLAGQGNAIAVKLSALCDPAFLVSLSERLAPFFTKTDKPEDLSIESLSQGLDPSPPRIHISYLSEEENRQLRNILKLLDAFGQRCCFKGVKFFVDAEWGYFAPAIHHLALTLQYKYNRQYPHVFNTYQCYKKGTYDLLMTDLSLMDKLGFCFGAKFVRGAYMEGERTRALKLNYRDPINDSFEETTNMYHRCVDTVLERIVHTNEELVVASQNENTVQQVICKMAELGIPPSSKQVSFAQTNGMVDHISIALGLSGFSVYKLLEYGSVDTLLTWLSRRAFENKPTVQRTAQERELLWKELSRRIRSCRL